MAVATTADLLQEGLALHRRGAVAEAAARYAQVLRAEPGNADAHYYLAAIACQHGRFDEGAERARQALAGDPRHARAHVLLGRSLGALKQPDAALASFDAAIAITPDLAQAHGNRGDILSELGRHAEAVEAYDRAVALAPDSTADWFNRGVALAAIGREDDALASFDRAIAGKRDYVEAHLWRAKLLAQRHRYTEALQGIDGVFTFAPGLAEAWLARGGVLTALRRFDDALGAYDKALQLKPDLAEAWMGRGNAHVALGKPELAIEAARRALDLNETAQTQRFFAQCLRMVRVTADRDGNLRRPTLRALVEGWAQPRELMPSCISLVVLDGAVSDCVARADRAWPKRLPAAELFGPSALDALAGDELLRGLLECAPITDIGFERLLTNIRSVMLAAAETNQTCDERLLGFYCAVARQCYVNDYVYSLADGEAERVERLRAGLEAALEAGTECSALWPVAVGAYGPLHALSKAAALLERTFPQCVRALLVQQVEEPMQERRLAVAMPALTGIDSEVSRSVRQQYEENPYPRWVKAALPAERSHDSTDVLVAGCGTGLSAVTIAQERPEARILAIDLSLASLSYAQRMAQQLGCANIEFAQADITKAAELRRMFDFIDVSGVLHHLADPWDGWRGLLALLHPGGTMRVCLYSKLARQNVVAARTLIAERGYRATSGDIRRCREEILAAADGSLLKSTVVYSDFFTTNECRDLLFHVQEHRMALTEIKSFLAANGLAFTGFDLDAKTLHAFTARFPEREALFDLDRWQAFELLAPETFASMYRFTVRKPSPGSEPAGKLV
jgi:tetratricopeptide (TPR) repeat protein/SAM-dependent methyltransferase